MCRGKWVVLENMKKDPKVFAEKTNFILKKQTILKFSGKESLHQTPFFCSTFSSKEEENSHFILGIWFGTTAKTQSHERIKAVLSFIYLFPLLGHPN